METMTVLRRLFDYNTWATRRLIEALKEPANQSAKALQALTHLVFAEQEWLARLNAQKDSTGVNFWAELSLEACEALNNQNQQAFEDLFGKLDELKLDSLAIYKNSKGTEYRTPFRDVLTHVALHSTYHRGQVAMAIRAEGGSPPNTDFIIYQREHESR
jgi:uncharacterized damage-inducible protein DinB